MAAHLGTRIYTWLRGEAVGGDGAGNRYYREKGGGTVHPDSLRKELQSSIYGRGIGRAFRHLFFRLNGP